MRGRLAGPDTPEAHAHLLLFHLMAMDLKPIERHEPFGPWVAWVNGSRSAIPSDFAVLAHIRSTSIALELMPMRDGRVIFL